MLEWPADNPPTRPSSREQPKAEMREALRGLGQRVSGALEKQGR